MKRLPRRHAPDFVRRRKLARDERFAQFLAFAMVFDHDRAKAALEWSEECRTHWADANGVDDLPNDALGELLLAVVGDAIAAAGLGRTATMGLSSGYDSRPILTACRQLGIQPRTYTFGQAGNLDFDLVKLIANRTGLNNFFIDTSLAEWSLELFDDLGKWDTNLLISPRVPAAHMMDSRHPERIDIHGYLNDSLTGVRRPDTTTVETGWTDAKRAFSSKNDQFGLQPLMPPGLLYELLPSEPILDRSVVPFHRQLDLGYRQAQRIRPVSQGSPVWVLPYEDRRWVGFWLNRRENDLIDQRRWIRFIHSLGGELFFDLASLKHLDSRGKLRRHRLDLVYGNAARPGLVIHEHGKALPENPTQHFSVLACYHNNTSFRIMVESSITRLKGRQVFDETFVNDVHSRFSGGDIDGAKILHGLVTVDIALEAGVFG